MINALNVFFVQNGKSENVEPVSLILDIPEDGIPKDAKKSEKPSEDEQVEETAAGNKSESAVRANAASVEKNFITPILQLFQKRMRTAKNAQVRYKSAIERMNSQADISL